MKQVKLLTCLLLAVVLAACEKDSETTDSSTDNTTTTLHKAFDVFDAENVSAVLNGSAVTITTTGLPNHTSPYWSSTTARSAPGGVGPSTPAAATDHPLFVAPSATTFDEMAPGNIDDFNGSYTLTVLASPQKASSSTATGLGAIGIAISGAVIYNDEEGPNVPLDNAASSLDYSGAHTGPQSYHYHLEPKAWSNDDSKLIGIISDGFFLYGRKCHSTGSYPNDLDASGGHTSITQYSEAEEYHYHTSNDLYLNQYYILFPGDYQGTPSSVN